jgi:putative N6-adenine-specific DNA methylase
MTQRGERYAVFAVAAPGLEPLVAEELTELGARATPEPGGVAWEADAAGLGRANLELRTASRVVVRVAEFRARSFIELERHARRIPWERFVAPGRAVQLRVTCRKSRLYHEGAVEQRLLEAVEHRVGGVRTGPAPADNADGAGGAAGAEPESEGEDSQLFVVRFLHDRCTLSADSSGALLHRRGYRVALAKAPLRETLAAAMLRAAGWHGQAPLVDPMCGAGTIPIEAALIARRIAPGLARGREPRNFAFHHWPEFESADWERVVADARERVLDASPVPIHGSDRDAGAIEAARANAERAGVAADLALAVAPLSAAEAPAGTGWLVTNPPYGVRVGESRPLRNLYAALGRLGRERFAGWRLALLSADRQLEAQLGTELREALATTNGGLRVRLVVGAG